MGEHLGNGLADGPAPCWAYFGFPVLMIFSLVKKVNQNHCSVYSIKIDTYIGNIRNYIYIC